MIKELFFIKEIPKEIAQRMVITNHYLHRKAPCSYAYGLFDKKIENKLIGVIMYGSPVSSALKKGVCGEEEKDNVIELTRLWISDDYDIKNIESFLIANTLKLVDKEIIISYADPCNGHVGFVYQATNWLYTGLSSRRKEYKVKGYTNHCHTLFDKYKSVKNIIEVFGKENVTHEHVPRKYRYIFLNCSKKRKKELLKKFKYPIVKEYPKKAEIFY